MSEQYSKGDQVRFLGLSNDPRRSGIGGGAWNSLPVGAVGTLSDTPPAGDDHLFVDFPGHETPFDTVARLMGLPTGWPILACEVERVETDVAA